MPIVKKNEPMKERPVIIAIYGGPGLGKTSLFNTAKNPLLLDFDRGVDRSLNRNDTLIVNDWGEVIEENAKGSFKGYATIGIDTAKAALDDFLMTYVRKIDPKNRTNKLAAYGAIGEEFKIFVNDRRNDLSDIVIICHSKEKEEGGLNMTIPDVTGQSYQLILRIADMVGFIYTRSNKRMIRFDPTDETKGKNVAMIPEQEIPDHADPAYKTYMADLIEKVRKSLVAKSHAQLEAEGKVKEYLDRLTNAESPDELTDLMAEVNILPDFYAKPLKKEINEKAKAKGYIANVTLKRYEMPGTPVAETVINNTASVQKNTINEQKPAQSGIKLTSGGSQAVILTTVDERTKELEKAGARIEADGFSYGKGFKQFMNWDVLSELSEDDFNLLIKSVPGKGGKK